jgi:hypothetical protein
MAIACSCMSAVRSPAPAQWRMSRCGLPGQMGRYELRVPHTSEELVAAMRASLNLTELSPEPISFPLLAAMYRAVLGRPISPYTSPAKPAHSRIAAGRRKSHSAGCPSSAFGEMRTNLCESWNRSGDFDVNDVRFAQSLGTVDHWLKTRA